MVTRFNDWARPHLARLTGWSATPFSIILHTIFFITWWISGAAQIGLAIAMSVEAIVLALIIIDKQNIDADRDHCWQKTIFTELLEKMPDARPELAEHRD